MLRLMVCLALGLCAAGCSMNSLASDAPESQFPPDAKAVIRATLEHPVSTSDPTYDEHTQGPAFFPVQMRVSDVALGDKLTPTLTMLHGWAWRACMRATISGAPAVLAVFVDGGRIVDVRTALVVDRCDNEHYTPLVINRPEPPAKPKNEKGKKKKKKGKS